MRILQKQQGYTATAMVIMLAVAGIVTAGTARHTINTAAENQGAAYGKILADINNAVGNYQVNNYHALVYGTAVTGVVNPLVPTVQELQSLGLLNANINPTPPLGGAYAIQLTREPSGCVAPNCNLTSRVWLTEPIINPETGNLDIRKLGAATAAIGGDGGWSDNTDPANVHGASGWSRANPAGIKGGILMAINGYGSTVFAQFVDRAGTQGMLAALSMGGNDINSAGTVNAADVTATGTVAASTANISGDINTSSGTTLNNAGRQHIQAAENLYLQPWGGGTTIIGGGGGNGNLIAAGQVQAGALQSNGTLNVGGNATINGMQSVYGGQRIYGDATVTNALTPGQIANNGWGCGTPGAIARDGSNNLYICN